MFEVGSLSRQRILFFNPSFLYITPEHTKADRSHISLPTHQRHLSHQPQFWRMLAIFCEHFFPRREGERKGEKTPSGCTSLKHRPFPPPPSPPTRSSHTKSRRRRRRRRKRKDRKKKNGGAEIVQNTIQNTKKIFFYFQNFGISLISF